MENPFLYGSPVEGTSFINRTSEVREISSDLARGQNIVIYSPRRYGKTSLIKAAIGNLEKKGIHCFYMDLLHITDVNSFTDYYGRAITGQLKTPAEKAFRWAKGKISALRLNMAIDEQGKPSLGFGFGSEAKGKPQTLQELLNFIESFMKHEKKKACIIFDEFQEIELIPESEYLQKQMRACFQHQKCVSYAFLGSKQHLLTMMFKTHARPFYNFCKHHVLEIISLPDWEKYVHNCFNNGGYSFSQNLADDIFQITQGHPSYMQLFCSVVWDLFREKKVIPEDYIRKSITHVLRNQQHAYHEIWDRLTMKQRQLVAAVAQEKEAEIYSGSFMQKFGYSTPAALQRAAQKLLQEEILIRHTARVQIADPIFRLWLTAFDYQYYRPGIFAKANDITDKTSRRGRI